MSLKRIAIVGASLAGLNAARTLREEGFDGRLTVIGDEPHMPYDRPPLSKQVLVGDWPLERTALDLDEAALAVDWRLGCRAVGLDLHERAIELDDGRREPFDGLVIATGATPRRPFGSTLPGTHVLRTLDDAAALGAELRGGAERVAIIGGGFIGAEVAAACRRMGLEVTLIEALPMPLTRLLGDDVGAVLADLHRERGVDVRVGVTVTSMVGRSRVERLHLSDGTDLAADVVVVAIGVTPATEWLAGSDLTIDNGVVLDATCLAAPGVVAAGDIARWPNPLFGDARRIEHWENAIKQSEHAARRLLAGDGAAGRIPFSPVPWVWSDQYEYKFQVVGSPVPHDEVRVVEGTTESRRFLALYRRGDRLVAAMGVGRARHILRLRKLLETDPGWDDALRSFDGVTPLRN
jgi:3-phenylpropionate/trans-cinnamate dioxygenase ferredoxin reductase subunit